MAYGKQQFEEVVLVAKCISNVHVYSGKVEEHYVLAIYLSISIALVFINFQDINSIKKFDEKCECYNIWSNFMTDSAWI